LKGHGGLRAKILTDGKLRAMKLSSRAKSGDPVKLF